ncbi:MAG TPA: serine O-acetyltransferase [Stellaceae bacterium]|nr:serine O-acetyltransferase [Stellaceae bacterium]
MLFKNLREEIDTVIAKDPAARSRLEVVFCYPGFHSILFYRVAHWLWVRKWLLLGRFVSHLGRLLTGIEIHPGAQIGRRFFIDHGMGVVIGETAEIGDDVTLYQGVTLGGTSLHHGKRHPTLADGVIVGSGAQILGGFTVGRDARVGANAVVLAEVPPGVTVVGIPAKPVGAPRPVAAKTMSDFLPYGTPCDEIPDPVARVLNGLLDEVQSLRARLQEVEHQVETERSAPVPLRPVEDEPVVAERRKA